MGEGAVEAFEWIRSNAIVDVSDVGKAPSYVKYVVDHVHENGVCYKNRRGPKCGVDKQV